MRRLLDVLAARRAPRCERHTRRRVRVAAAAGACLALGGITAPGIASAPPGPAVVTHSPPVSIGLQVLTLIDRTRMIRLAHRRPYPRTLETLVRYPRTSGASVRVALPLIVFVHGYNVTPASYDQLLDAWTRAGFVVAAPVFPLEAHGAPGGPTQADLVNEPADVSFVIGRLIASSAEPGQPLSGRIDARHIAVAGHSDGGIVALSLAYGRHHRDRRIGAALVLSGARPFDDELAFAPHEVPLLASMGTTDTINAPANTLAYYRLARRPKFLLRLVGAAHLPPFSYAQPWLGVVERVTTTFLDTYLKEGGVPPPAFGVLPRSALLESEP